ncbi:hypothetical protein CEXT_348221 [Caerostris extrusa]|uniref:Secreted protein n=1 Tax=Caerostris extrusa TaxID=172846 RepID=A0AAV4Y841_CAEEX|nr:hypothetical protein CEXT_348221 [Caerostris extrusa]
MRRKRMTFYCRSTIILFRCHSVRRTHPVLGAPEARCTSSTERIHSLTRERVLDGLGRQQFPLAVSKKLGAHTNSLGE